MPDHYVLNLEIFGNISSTVLSSDGDDDDGDYDYDYVGDDEDDDDEYGSDHGNGDSLHAKMLPESSSSLASSLASSSSSSSERKLRMLLSTPCLSKVSF